MYFIYYSLGKDYVLPVKQKNTDRNHVIEPKKHIHTHTHTHTHTSYKQRKMTLERVGVKISDAPLFRTTLYFTKRPFWKNFENSIPLFSRWGFQLWQVDRKISINKPIRKQLNKY